MNLRDRLNGAFSGEYVLDREISGGGMASVFVAEEQALGRTVVLKVLPPELAAEVSEERFRREVLLAARLQHPHIVPIFSAGEADGLLYYTMPLVEGETLRSRLLREGELPVTDAIRVLACIADAMAYAHSHGVVHRDIKPENILLSGQHAVVTDFGIAKALGDSSSSSRLTATGLAMGTAAYMAPEQVAADPAVDHRADIYALGIVAYELLAGAPPFSARTAQQLAAAHLAQQPDAITTKRAAIPAGLATLIMACLEKRPADRPQSAELLADELSQLAISGGLSATTGIRPRSRRTIVTASAIVLVTASLVAAAAMYRNRGTANTVGGKRVVVAAFANETGDESLVSFGKMAADWVTQGLQETGFIDVVDSRTVLQASQQLSGNASVVEALSTQTGAAIVVSGSYYTELDSLIVRARVVDASDGKILRTVSVQRVSRKTPSMALEILRDQVLASLAPLVDPRLATWETSLKPPTYAAYRVYMEGLETYVAQNLNVAYDSSAVQFARAVQLDSTFQTARLWQAFTLFLAGWTKSPRFLRQTDSVLSVLQLHHDDLGPYDRRFYNWFLALRRSDMQATYVAAREMMNASPGSAHAIWEMALAAVRTNRPKEALQLLDRPELSRGPRGSLFMEPYATWKAAAFHMLKDYDSELQVARTYSVPLIEARANAGLGNTGAALEQARLFPESAGPNQALRAARILVEELVSHGKADAAMTVATRAINAYWTSERSARPSIFARIDVATILYAIGRFDEAGALLTEAATLDSASFPTIPAELEVRGLVAVSAARTGDRATAQRISLDIEARKLDVAFRPAGSYWRARIAATLGDSRTAISLFRRAVGEGYLPLPSPVGRFLHTDPDMSPLLTLPELQELVRPKR